MILTSERFAEWPDPGTPPRRLHEILTAFPTDRMAAAEANPVVNKAGFEGAGLPGRGVIRSAGRHGVGAGWVAHPATAMTSPVTSTAQHASGM